MPRMYQFDQTGGPENLKLRDLSLPEPASGEVKLRIKAVGLNRAEAMYLRGIYLETPELPSRIGYEAAGIVEAVGPDVDNSWIGKRVATIPGFSMNKYGLLGEEAIVPAKALGEYPEALSPVEAAAIWMQYLTAYGALVEIGKLSSSDFVIITAASSSVGLAAIQIVKAEGATAIAATRTSKKRDPLLAAGAHHVIATAEENLPDRVREITGGKGARLIFDPVAGPYIETLAQAASKNAILFEYGALSLEPTPFPLLIGLRKALSLRAYVVHEITQDPKLLETAKKYVYERLKDGRFHPVLARTFPFEQAVDAYRYLESNEQFGKIVITVDGKA